MPRRLATRLDTVLARYLPEQRLFLRSDSGTRFVRLRPVTQLAALGGASLLFGWTIIASSVLVIDGISAGSASQQARASQQAFEARLTDLAAERDAANAEALAAQGRFASALDQVSAMQSQLLTSEQRRRELETGVGVVQATLHKTLAERPALVAAADANGAPATATARAEEFSVALDIVTGALKQASTARTAAETEAEKARAEATRLAAEKAEIIERHDEIFAQLEDAVSVSVEPLDKMFRSVGMDPDNLLKTIRKGYSGQGGPLTPIAYSTRGDAAITQGEARANEVLVSLDKMNSYRIAAEKLPLAMPVTAAFRYTSQFGRRWGRAHEGIDMAGPVGTPVYATGEGVVVYAGWQRGYGNVIKIQHALETETRYGHLSKIRVKAGTRVSQGTRIGDMGNTGRSTGPHLHYEVRVKGQAVDPLRFIKAAQNVF